MSGSESGCIRCLAIILLCIVIDGLIVYGIVQLFALLFS